MSTKEFITNIRQQIAKDELKEAITALQTLLENSPKLNEVLLQSARHNDILKQVRLGIVDDEQANVTKNKIRQGLLELLSEVEDIQVEKPMIKKEMDDAIISIVNSKNVLIGSNINASGNVTIGDTTTTITESQISRRLRLFLFLLVPILAIGGTYLWWQNQEMKRPLQLKVLIKNKTPNAYLPEPTGILTLTYGGATDKKETTTDAFFDGIPSSTEEVILTYKAKGFVSIDTTFALESPSLDLWVSRNNDRAILKGSITDEDGNPLEDVKISIDCCSTMTTADGDFLLKIPFKHQQMKQRLRVLKKGYKSKDITTPIQAREPVRLILEKS